MNPTNKTKLPPSVLVFYVGSSVFLLGYGAFGLYVGDLFVRAGTSRGVHFQGAPAWFMYGAFVFAALSMLSRVVQHFARNPNYHAYRRFAKLTELCAWSFFGGSCVLAVAS